MKTFALRLSAAAIALQLVLAGAAQAAPHGVFWSQGQGPSSAVGPEAQAVNNLLYYGGPVIEHAKVTAVFWGDNVAAETKSKIGPFFANMLDSTYMDFLKEYDTAGIRAVDGRMGTNQHIGRGSYAGAVTIKPSNAATSLTDAMIQAELEAQIAAGKLPPADDNNLYMVYFPSGFSIEVAGMRSCSTFCAYHEGFKSQKLGASVFYGIMPVCGFGCGFGSSAFDSLTIVSSHEAIEAVTDPFPTPGDKPAYPQAWNTTKGEEIGDVCAQGNSTVTGHGIVSKVQWEWQNSIGACNKGPWTQFGLASAAPSALRPVSSTRPLPWLGEFRPTRALWDGR